MTEFVEYKPEYKGVIINIFLSNCSKYFHLTDLPDLVNFLDIHAYKNYLIVKTQGKICGCGGHYVNHKNKTFGIAWVMFRRNDLGPSKFKNIANEFFNEIMNRIKNENVDYEIVINTTQLLSRFFSIYGFTIVKTIKDGFGKGLDHYIMKLQLK